MVIRLCNMVIFWLAKASFAGTKTGLPLHHTMKSKKSTELQVNPDKWRVFLYIFSKNLIVLEVRPATSIPQIAKW